jgi:hypothetical protein
MLKKPLEVNGKPRGRPRGLGAEVPQKLRVTLNCTLRPGWDRREL